MTAVDGTVANLRMPRMAPMLRRPEIASSAFLFLLVILLAVTVPAFRTSGNLQGIVSTVAVTGVVALAVNQVILCGEIDISTGSALGLTAAVAGAVAVHTGGVVAPLAAAMAVGLVVGIINGLLSTVARIPSIIVTLGTLNVIRGGCSTNLAERYLTRRKAPNCSGAGSPQSSSSFCSPSFSA